MHFSVIHPFARFDTVTHVAPFCSLCSHFMDNHMSTWLNYPDCMTGVNQNNRMRVSKCPSVWYTTDPSVHEVDLTNFFSSVFGRHKKMFYFGVSGTLVMDFY